MARGGRTPGWVNPNIPWYENPKLTIYDVPQVGKWVGRVGHIIDIFGTPCADSGDAEIWVYATFNSVPRMLIALFKPDQLDLEAKRWGIQHKRNKKRKFKILDELVIKMPQPKGLGWAIGALGNEWAQRVGWYLLVADATTEGAVNWTSTAYTYAGCRFPGAPYCSSDCLETVAGPFAAGRYLWPGWVVKNEHILAGDGDSIAIPAGYVYSIGASFTTIPLDAPFTEASVSGLEMVNLATGDVVAKTATQRTFDGQQWGTMVYRQNTGIHAGEDIGVFYTKTEGFFRTKGGRFTATATLDPGLNPDP